MSALIVTTEAIYELNDGCGNWVIEKFTPEESVNVRAIVIRWPMYKSTEVVQHLIRSWITNGGDIYALLDYLSHFGAVTVVNRDSQGEFIVFSRTEHEARTHENGVAITRVDDGVDADILRQTFTNLCKGKPDSYRLSVKDTLDTLIANKVLTGTYEVVEF